MNELERRQEFIVNFVYGMIVLAISLLGLKFTTHYLMPFVFGFLIAFILKPLVLRLHQRFGERRWLSLLSIIIFYLLMGFLLFWLIVAIISGIESVAQALPTLYNDTLYPNLQKIIDYLGKFVNNLDPEVISIIEQMTDSIFKSLENIVRALSSGALNVLTKIIASVPSFLVSVLIAIISSFFFTMDYRQIVNKTLGFLPVRLQVLVMDVKDGLVSVVGKYIRAYAMIMGLTFIELSIGFFILGIDNPISLAAMIAMVDILPVLGTGGVVIPWIIIELIRGNVSLAIGLTTLYVIVTVIRNIMEPKVVGKQIGLHPLVTLMSIYVGVKLFGFWGLLGLPIAITIIKSLHDEGKIELFQKKA